MALRSSTRPVARYWLIGRVTLATGLPADMPELGHVDGKAAASLIGVAPWTRESGQWQGRSFIRGGRARPRRLL